jgi:hypothetical protein
VSGVSVMCNDLRQCLTHTYKVYIYVYSTFIFLCYVVVDVLVYPFVLCGFSECFCSLLLAASQRFHSWCFCVVGSVFINGMQGVCAASWCSFPAVL